MFACCGGGRKARTHTDFIAASSGFPGIVVSTGNRPTQLEGPRRGVGRDVQALSPEFSSEDIVLPHDRTVLDLNKNESLDGRAPEATATSSPELRGNRTSDEVDIQSPMCIKDQLSAVSNPGTRMDSDALSVLPGWIESRRSPARLHSRGGSEVTQSEDNYSQSLYWKHQDSLSPMFQRDYSKSQSLSWINGESSVAPRMPHLLTVRASSSLQSDFSLRPDWLEPQTTSSELSQRPNWIEQGRVALEHFDSTDEESEARITSRGGSKSQRYPTPHAAPAATILESEPSVDGTLSHEVTVSSTDAPVPGWPDTRSQHPSWIPDAQGSEAPGDRAYRLTTQDPASASLDANQEESPSRPERTMGGQSSSEDAARPLSELGEVSVEYAKQAAQSGFSAFYLYSSGGGNEPSNQNNRLKQVYETDTSKAIRRRNEKLNNMRASSPSTFRRRDHHRAGTYERQYPRQATAENSPSDDTWLSTRRHPRPGKDSMGDPRALAEGDWQAETRKEFSSSSSTQGDIGKYMEDVPSLIMEEGMKNGSSTNGKTPPAHVGDSLREDRHANNGASSGFTSPGISWVLKPANTVSPGSGEVNIAIIPDSTGRKGDSSHHRARTRKTGRGRQVHGPESSEEGSRSSIGNNRNDAHIPLEDDGCRPRQGSVHESSRNTEVVIITIPGKGKLRVDQRSQKCVSPRERNRPVSEGIEGPGTSTNADPTTQRDIESSSNGTKQAKERQSGHILITPVPQQAVGGEVHHDPLPSNPIASENSSDSQSTRRKPLLPHGRREPAPSDEGNSTWTPGQAVETQYADSDRDVMEVGGPSAPSAVVPMTKSIGPLRWPYTTKDESQGRSRTRTRPVFMLGTPSTRKSSGQLHGRPVRVPSGLEPLVEESSSSSPIKKTPSQAGSPDGAVVSTVFVHTENADGDFQTDESDSGQASMLQEQRYTDTPHLANRGAVDDPTVGGADTDGAYLDTGKDVGTKWLISRVRPPPMSRDDSTHSRRTRLSRSSSMDDGSMSSFHGRAMFSPHHFNPSAGALSWGGSIDDSYCNESVVSGITRGSSSHSISTKAAPDHSRLLKSQLSMQDKELIDRLKINRADVHFGYRPVRGSKKVYKAELNGEMRAAKVISILHMSKEARAAMQQAFFPELLQLSKLDSLNVVKVYGASVSPAELIIVSEFVEGGTLRDLLGNPLRRRKFKTRTRLQVAHDVAAGMKSLNENGIQHRRLTSFCVLLTQDWRAKVAGAGMLMTSEIVSSPSNEEYGSSHDLLWESREVLAGAGFCEKSDVYSFGIVLWEIMREDGSLPYAGVSSKEVMRLKYCGEGPPMPSGCPLALQKLMENCWGNLPSNRPSFKKICETLEYFSNDATVMSGI